MLIVGALMAAPLITGCEAEQLEAKATKAAAAKLRDPDAAKFTDIVVHEKTVCGLVNGKNAFGAYAGAAKFAWDETNGAVIIDPEATGSAAIMETCLAEQRWADCNGRVTLDQRTERKRVQLEQGGAGDTVCMDRVKADLERQAGR